MIRGDYTGYELRCMYLLDEADLVDIVLSQIWRHEELFSEEPKMIALAASLKISFIKTLARRLEVAPIDIADGPFKAGNTPIVFASPKSTELYISVYGSSPAKAWGI